MRLLLAIPVAALLAATGAACSGGDDESPDAGPTTTVASTTERPETTTTTETTTEEAPPGARPEPPPDQSRWAREVDRACKPWQERIDAVPPPTDAASLGTWVDRTLPLLRGQIGAVQEVPVPRDEADARRARRFVRSLEELAASFDRLRLAIRVRNAEEVQASLVAASAAGASARASALALGVTECGGYAQG